VTVEDLDGLTRALGGDPDLMPTLIGYGTRQLC
jgi:hypothetical protein